MNIPADLKYTRDHEWLKIEDDEALVGITDYAQGELGDIVYLELPEIGAEINQGDSFGTIEAVKAASDLFTPITGEVMAVNSDLDQAPETINNSPYDKGWIIRIKITDMDELDSLLSPAEYREAIEG
ncbi:glycine cleavage system protein GcvH [Calditrichota bacterium]